MQNLILEASDLSCIADLSNTTFYPNTNTQYFQRGLNNTQNQYQFFDDPLTIPNTNSNIHEQS